MTVRSLNGRVDRLVRHLGAAVVFVLALLVSGAPAAARPKIGLVLSGGGALGASHVGVLKVLEELGVPIDVIAGTSMGAIVGGLYAAGYRARELENLVEQIDWVTLFKDSPDRALRPFQRKQDDYSYLTDLKVGVRNGAVSLPSGVLQGQNLMLLLRWLTRGVRGIQDFDQLPIPFRAVAADLENGEPVVLGHGDLAAALRASMSVPGAFPPVEIGHRALVDGGVANNLPIDVARAMGADIVIVAEIPTKLKKRDELDSAVTIINQMVSILIDRSSKEQLKRLRPGDILIETDLGDRTTVDFTELKGMIGPGEAAARARLRELRALVAQVGGPAAVAPGRGVLGGHPPVGIDPAPPVIAFVDIDNRSDVSDVFIRSRIPTSLGQRLDVAALERGISELYATEDFRSIEYQVIDRDGRSGLVVTAVGKSWAKNFIRFGLSLASDFSGNSSFNLGGTFTLGQLNSYGGEWRSGAQIGDQPSLYTELYQPLDPERETFVRPRVVYGSTTVLAGTDGALSEFRVTRGNVQLGGGLNLDHWGMLEFGTRHGFGDGELRVGTARQTKFDFTTGQAFARLSFDTLDHVNFPTDGGAGFLEIAESQGLLGASSDFGKVEFRANWAESWYRNTLLIGTMLGTSREDNLPVEERFQLGGFLSLSGLLQNQLSGRNLAFGRLLYYRKLTQAAPELFGLPVYAGASLEAGNVWEQRDAVGLSTLRYSGSLFAGADTYLGPLYLGYGRTLDGESSFYMFLGQAF